MARRSYVKIGRRAEFAGRYTSTVNPADGFLSGGGDGGDGSDGGIQGPPGKDGEGVPKGGATGQVLAKKTTVDFDTEWVDTSDDSDLYVHTTGGDFMQGPLEITGGRSPNADGIESTVIALNIDSGQSSSLNLKWKGGTKVYIGEKQTILAGDLKFNVGGKKIYAGNDEDKGFQVNDSGVFYDGAYTVDRHVATKKNVDDAIALIGADKEGLFTWDASSTDLPIGTWQFEGRSNPSYTESGVQVVNIQKQDKNGLTFSDTDFEVGGQIEIKNVSNNDYLLGTITSIVDGGPKSVQITFNRDRATGQATGDQTIKSVKEPLPYVNKSGDAMSGDLKMKDNAQIQFIDPVGSPTLIRAGREDAEYPMILDLRHPGGSNKGGYDIKVQGNSSYNSLRFTNAKGPVFEVNGGGGATFGSEFKMDVSLDNNRIRDLGDAVEDTDAVPYGQVKREVSEAFDEITTTLSFGNFSYIATSAARGVGVLTSFGAYPSTNGQKNPANVGSLGVHHTAGDDSEVGWSSLNPGDIIRWARGANVWQFRVNGTPQAQDSGDSLWYQIPVNKGTGPTFIESGIGNFDYTLQVLRLTGGSADLTDYLRLDGTSKMTGDLDMNQKRMEMVSKIDFTTTGELGNEGTTRLKIRKPSSGTDGNAQVEVERPASGRRGFSIRGCNEDKSKQFDLLYSYHNPEGTPDRIIYRGATSSDTAIQTKASVLDLIASGGIGGDGTAFQRHGPYHYKPGNVAVVAGQFTSNSDIVKDIREFTFHRKNTADEDQIWNDLAIGEVMTIVQEEGDVYVVINYTVTSIQNYAQASIVGVDAHQTIIAYSDGHVVYNPGETYQFQEDTDTFVIESQPANLNNVLDLAKKASPGPGYISYIMDTGTGEPLRGVEIGTMISSGSSNIQTPTKFIFSCFDVYGNGHKWGNNNFNCPGSIVELYRKNNDGTLCLCKVYEFDRVECLDNKFEFLGLVQKHSATNTNNYIQSPGVIAPGAEYFVQYNFNFSTTIYTVDSEGDPHYGDHRLEDVGHPVAATDAATKGYVDAIAGNNGGGSDLPVFKFASKEIEDLQTGQFVCYDSSNNITTELGRIRAIAWKGTDVNGKRPIRDDGAITWDGNLNSTFSLLISNGTKTVLRTSMSQIINGHPTISYLAAFDVYCIQWTGGDTTVMTSDFTRMTNSQSVTFHCSELFF